MRRELDALLALGGKVAVTLNAEMASAPCPHCGKPGTEGLLCDECDRDGDVCAACEAGPEPFDNEDAA